MSILWRRLLPSALLIILLLASVPYAQESLTGTDDDSSVVISLHSFVDRTQIPLNRTFEFVVRLQWSGDLQRFEILPFDNPILQNFDITGSGSSNTVSIVDGVKTAVRDYTFTLMPQSIGMGYIEPIIIKYTDMLTGVDHVLTSNRIPVKVTPPVSEGGVSYWILLPALLLIVVIVVFGRRYYIVKKKKREAAESEAAAENIPMEEKYLQELAAIVDLNDAAYDGVKALSHITRLLRRYLHDKFSTPGFEATTGEVTQFLYDHKFQDHFVNEVKDLLSSADIAKFSGKNVSRADVEKSYAIVENILHKGARDELSFGELTTKSENEN